MDNLGNKQIMADNIKRLLSENNLSHTDICNALGFKMPTFSDWVHAKTYPRIDKIELMANYFGVSKADLVERYNPDTSKDQRLLRIESDFKTLNDKGKDEAVKRVDELTQIPGYTEPQLELLAAHERDDSRKEKGISAEDEKRQIINRQLNKIRETPIE